MGHLMQDEVEHRHIWRDNARCAQIIWIPITNNQGMSDKNSSRNLHLQQHGPKKHSSRDKSTIVSMWDKARNASIVMWCLGVLGMRCYKIIAPTGLLCTWTCMSARVQDRRRQATCQKYQLFWQLISASGHLSHDQMVWYDKDLYDRLPTRLIFPPKFWQLGQYVSQCVVTRGVFYKTSAIALPKFLLLPLHNLVKIKAKIHKSIANN